MPLNDRETVVKTSGYITPSSMSGVINQQRYWNPGTGAGQVDPTAPDVRNDFRTAAIKTNSKFAELNRRIIELNLQGQRDLLAMQEQQQRDVSSMNWQRFDKQNERTVVDQIGRGVAAYQAVGDLAFDIANKSSKKDEYGNVTKMSKVAGAIAKLPLIGPTKSSNTANALMGKLKAAIKSSNQMMMETTIQQIDDINSVYRLTNNLRTEVADLLSPEELDRIFGEMPDYGEVDRLWDIVLQGMGSSAVGSRITEGE